MSELGSPKVLQYDEFLVGLVWQVRAAVAMPPMERASAPHYASPIPLAVDMPDLKARLEDLPPELYDFIFKLTFTPEPGVRTIDHSYRPQSIMQVDCTTRAMVAKSYYGQGATFYCTNHEYCIRWLASLPVEHSGLLAEVRVESVSNLWKVVAANSHAKMHRLFVTRTLSKKGIASDPRVLYFRALGGDDTLNWTNCN